MSIQINGKKRGVFDLKRDSSEEVIVSKIMQDKNLSKYLNGQKLKKTIFVKNKIVNIII